MLVFDFFAGTGSSTRAFEDAGHTVIKFELDPQFDADEQVDILQLTAESLVAKYGRPDFVWASPPCTSFSIASISHHWISTGVPRSEAARESMKLVAHTRQLIETLNPTFGFVIENPRGMLRKLPLLEGLTRWTVTYCQYGDDRMKPTDLWTNITTWLPRVPCSNGGGAMRLRLGVLRRELRGVLVLRIARWCRMLWGRRYLKRLRVYS